MPTLLLMNRSFDVIGKISRYDNWNISLVGNGMDEISFDVHKYADGKLCPVWDDLIDLKIIDVSGFGRFEISVDYTDNTETVKSVHGFSLETELAQIGLYEFHINDDEATDMKITDYSNDYVDGKFIPTTFYNPDDKQHSLLHRVLADKAPHWSIGYVTKYIALDEESQPELASEFQRTYTVDGDSIYDFLTGTVAEESNVIFVFDTINRKINCYSLCDCIDQNTGKVSCTGIGEDTTVFVSKNKLANEITISSNKDNVKNCFRIEGGDDIITDMVRAVNMNGSNYIFQFADFQYNDMSEALRNKIIAYQKMMSSEETQNAYYGNGMIDGFINGNIILRVTSELDAATILNICQNNKIETGNKNLYSFTSSPYWHIAVSNDKKELRTTTANNYTLAETAINSMGIYTKLCNAYDILEYFESSMMPNTDTVTDPGEAKAQYDKVVEKLKESPVAVSSMNNYNNNLFVGVTNNIEAYAQIFLDSRFDLEVVSGTTSYSYTDGAETGTWKGKIRITQHTDETNIYPVDVAATVPIEVTVNADELEFAKQKVEKALSKGSMLDIDFDVAGMTSAQMREYFGKYSLNRLKSFYDGYNSCISILMELGLATTKNGTDSPVRVDIYDKYKQRLDIVKEVYDHRQKNVYDINKLIDDIQQEQNSFIYGDSKNGVPPHDFKTFIGDDLYVKFCAYRREDTYKNDNYVSDGLSTSECLAKAKELMEVAAKEAKKACVLQRTVSTSLNNLFALPEFEPLYEKFALFNYIRIRTEDEILKLRIIGIDFSGDSVEEIQVTFSEQIESIDGTMSDLQSIIQQTGNMATNFPSTVLQAKQGSEAKSTISDIYTNGLNAAKTMLTNNDSNEVTITQSGIICRRMDDEGFYGSKQIRITGNIMAFTDDAWETVKIAIGENIFKDPFDPLGEEKKGYGIFAENIVGNMIVGNNLFIGNQNKSVQITGDGIKITNGTITWGNGKNSVNAPEMGDIDGLEGSIDDLSNSLSGISNNFTKFQTDVKAVLGLGSTTITSSSVIAPKIGGGYLYITGTHGSVEINPNGSTIYDKNNKSTSGKIFSVKDSYDKEIISFDTNGNATFGGNLSSSKIFLNSNSVENIGSIVLNNLIETDGDSYKEITMINELASDSDNLAISFGFKNTDTSKTYATTGIATVKKKGKIYNNLYANTYLCNDKNSYISLSSAEYKGLYASNAIHTPRVFAGNYVHGDYALDVNGESYFSNKIYLSTGTYLNGLTGGGVYCDGQFNTLGKVCVGNTDYGYALNVNGAGYFSSNFTAGGNMTTSGNITANGNITADGELISKGSYDNVGTNAPNVMIGDKAYHIRRTSGSSKRFKDNIKPVDDGELNTDKLYDINVVQYKFKKDYLSKDDQRYNKDVIGFIAEDIFEKYPIAADYFIDEDGNTVVNDWNFRYIIPAMLKLIQEQKKAIDSLEKRISKCKQ